MIDNSVIRNILSVRLAYPNVHNFGNLTVGNMASAYFKTLFK